MPRPLKWSRDLHAIRDRADRSRTETWSRRDIQDLFSIGASSGQSLMRVIGEIQVVGGTYFIDRSSLLGFLDSMVAADSIEEAMRERLENAARVPRPRSLRVVLPAEFRRAMMPDLPANITVEPRRLEVRADSAVAMLESLVMLATVMQNDLDRFQQAIEPPMTIDADKELRSMFDRLRNPERRSEDLDR